MPLSESQISMIYRYKNTNISKYAHWSSKLRKTIPVSFSPTIRLHYSDKVHFKGLGPTYIYCPVTTSKDRQICTPLNKDRATVNVLNPCFQGHVYSHPLIKYSVTNNRHPQNLTTKLWISTHLRTSPIPRRTSRPGWRTLESSCPLEKTMPEWSIRWVRVGKLGSS